MDTADAMMPELPPSAEIEREDAICQEGKAREADGKAGEAGNEMSPEDLWKITIFYGFESILGFVLSLAALIGGYAILAEDGDCDTSDLTIALCLFLLEVVKVMNALRHLKFGGSWTDRGFIMNAIIIASLVASNVALLVVEMLLAAKKLERSGNYKTLGTLLLVLGCIESVSVLEELAIYTFVFVLYFCFKRNQPTAISITEPS